MSLSPANLEIEVKFFLQDRKAMRRKIMRAGATGAGRVFESNVRFDDPKDRLKNSGSLLRLRNDGRMTLTYKARTKQADNQFKVHRELEVEVDDDVTMEKILKALGFRRKQLYEKHRETFQLEGALLCLDQMPFGDFLEIEGPKAKIRLIAGLLELDWRRRILHNYLEMFAAIKREQALPFEDITFENFKNLRWESTSFMRRFEAE
jgi:adenylate cyclase class 2